MLEWESTYHCDLMGEQGAEPYMLNLIRQNAPTLESEILLLGLKTLCKTITFHPTCQLQYHCLIKEERIHNSLLSSSYPQEARH
jgi:hypothetical protein